MRFAKKIGIGLLAVAALLAVCLYYIIVTASPHARWKPSEESRTFYEDFDVVVIENIVDDPDGKLATFGLDIETLNNEAIKSFEEQIHRKMPTRKLDVSIIDRPYNLDNHPKALVVSLHWEVILNKTRGYFYKRTTTVKRKIDSEIKKLKWTGPGGSKIPYLKLPEERAAVQDELLRDLAGRLSSVVQMIERWD